MSPEAKLIVIFAFLAIIIVGELIMLIVQKRKFCKGKATVGFIIRKHLYSNNLTIEADGSEKINSSASDLVLSNNGQAITLVYANATVGWIYKTNYTS